MEVQKSFFFLKKKSLFQCLLKKVKGLQTHVDLQQHGEGWERGWEKRVPSCFCKYGVNHLLSQSISAQE